jgi:queuine/archaeosine tRNA-ribosyltransferase
MLGPRLLSYHNLARLAQLMADARDAIAGGTWAAFRDENSRLRSCGTRVHPGQPRRP